MYRAQPTAQRNPVARVRVAVCEYVHTVKYAMLGESPLICL